MSKIGRIIFFRGLSTRVAQNGKFRVGSLVDLARTDCCEAVKQLEIARKNQDIPDWSVVKIASYGLSKSMSIEDVEKFLKSHYSDTGGDQRLARTANITDEQIVAALKRILCSKEGKQKSVHLYKMLIDMKFCSNKDKFILPIVSSVINEEGIHAAYDIFLELQKLGKIKSLALTLFTLCQHSYISSDPDIKIKVTDLIVKYASPSKDWMIGFVQLLNEKGVQWAEDIYSKNLNLNIEGVRYLCMLADKMKLTKPLEELLKLSVLLKLDQRTKALIYEQLIQMYGKQRNFIELDRLSDLVLSEKDRNTFIKAMFLIKHFFRCADQQPSSRLLKVLQGHS